MTGSWCESTIATITGAHSKAQRGQARAAVCAAVVIARNPDGAITEIRRHLCNARVRQSERVETMATPSHTTAHHIGDGRTRRKMILAAQPKPIHSAEVTVMNAATLLTCQRRNVAVAMAATTPAYSGHIIATIINAQCPVHAAGSPCGPCWPVWAGMPGISGIDGVWLAVAKSLTCSMINAIQATAAAALIHQPGWVRRSWLRLSRRRAAAAKAAEVLTAAGRS